MGFEIIGKSCLGVDPDDSEKYYEEQGKQFLELCGNAKEAAYMLNGRLLYIDEVKSFLGALECCAIKEGASLVRFDSGHIGFVCYYGNYQDHLEVITDAAEVDAIAKKAEEEELNEYL